MSTSTLPETTEETEQEPEDPKVFHLYCPRCNGAKTLAQLHELLSSSGRRIITMCGVWVYTIKGSLPDWVECPLCYLIRDETGGICPRDHSNS